MISDIPRPDQIYAFEARERIATLRQREGAAMIELRWHPAHKGAPRNEKADDWAKIAADEVDSHGVVFLRLGDRYGRKRLPPLSPARLKGSNTETKWREEMAWADTIVIHEKYHNSWRARQTIFLPTPSFMAPAEEG